MAAISQAERPIFSLRAARIMCARRGAKSSRRRPDSQVSFNRASGTAVVLPAPGGATSTAAGLSRNAD
ncbi:MAG: hypothetical protein KFF68_13970 [Desulfosarcina sp.]|nr:hypothetical protein [Desulfosarcina sp.]